MVIRKVEEPMKKMMISASIDGGDEVLGETS